MHDAIQLTSGIKEAHNVLGQHHKKNRSNRPPDLARLSTAALHQSKKYGLDEDDTQLEGSDGEDQCPSFKVDW